MCEIGSIIGGQIMQKIKRGSKERRVYRAFLSRYNEQGVMVARRIYREQDGCTTPQAQAAVKEICDYLESQGIKTGKGIIDVDTAMEALTLTDIEMEEMDRERLLLGLIKVRRRQASNVQHLKETLRDRAVTIRGDMDYLIRRLADAENDPTSYANVTICGEIQSISAFESNVGRLSTAVATYNESGALDEVIKSMKADKAKLSKGGKCD